MGRGKVICSIFALAACCSFISACSALRLYRNQGSIAPASCAATPIYISDFTLPDGAFRREAGLLPVAPIRPGPLGSYVPRALGVPEDPALRSHELVDLMANALKEDLINTGLDARRLRTDGPLPVHGWLVRGTFTDMNEGNRLGRALVGLGAGRTHFQVFVFIDELTPGAAQSAYALNTSAASSAAPGAIFLFSPIAAAGRFISGGLDLDHSVEQTAAKIARRIEKRVCDQAGAPL